MSELKNQTFVHRGTPHELSQQLGVSVHEILAAIESAGLNPSENEHGRLEYDAHPVITAVLDNKRNRDAAENANLKRLLNECLASYQDAVRQMIREENKTAYQIKQMTESRFLEVLGQLSISLGRVEAFVAQSSRLLNQIDLRMARMGDSVLKVSRDQVSAAQQAVEQGQAFNLPTEATGSLSAKVNLFEQMTYNDHWNAFEAHLTRVFAANGMVSGSAATDWFNQVRRLVGMGSLELRLNSDAVLNQIRPCLTQAFTELAERLPEEKEVLPFFEVYNSWIHSEMKKGQPALLLFLLILIHRGAQISWSGFVSTFLSEE
jgi:hypothetical protein